MTYSIFLLKNDEIRTIKNQWKTLESGDDMTYFQSYDWYESWQKNNLPDCHIYESLYAVAERSGKIVMIAPLWIIKKNWRHFNRKGAYILGREGWSDYLNFIYKDFEIEAFQEIIKAIKERYHIDNFIFENMKEDSSLCKYVSSLPGRYYSRTNTCVALNVPNDEKDYMKLLSKNSRQNLRTAANRLSKDGHKLHFIFDDKHADLRICEEIRARRLPKKNKRSLKDKLKWFILNLSRIKYPKRLPFLFDKNCHIMSAYEGETLRAYFSYGIDTHHNSLVLMAVGTDTEFERYSPGMLLMFAFIKNQIVNNGIRYIDFTQGNERNKYSLGGKEHFIKSFKVKC